MWHMGDGYGWGVGVLGMVIFWIVIVAAVALVARLVWDRGGPRESSRASDTPLEILQRRYARGEIDRAEYEEKRRDLQ